MVGSQKGGGESYSLRCSVLPFDLFFTWLLMKMCMKSKYPCESTVNINYYTGLGTFYWMSLSVSLYQMQPLFSQVNSITETHMKFCIWKYHSQSLLSCLVFFLWRHGLGYLERITVATNSHYGQKDLIPLGQGQGLYERLLNENCYCQLNNAQSPADERERERERVWSERDRMSLSICLSIFDESPSGDHNTK